MNLSNAEVKAKLKQIPLFKQMKENDEIMDQIVAALKPVHFKAGNNIIEEGAAGEEMFILIKGEIEIAKFTMDKERFTVAKLKDSMNIFFGELALVDNDKRSATVTALTECHLLMLTRTKFHELGEQNAELGFHLTLEIASILSGRLRKANEDSIILFETLVNELSA